MTEFPTYYGILDNDKLRVGFVYNSLPKLIDSVSEAIIEVTNDEEILAEEPALVSMEDKYFYNGSLKFIKKIENLRKK